MEITEVRVTIRPDDKLKAFASITFDHCFVVRGLKVIEGNKGLFVAMPSRRRPDGTFQDIAHPINAPMREEIEGRVISQYLEEAGSDEGISQSAV
ncbi:MAG: septation regulator SpoVG [Gemmatimonadetes bacterium]|nr:septation regulator SpoVG [Gemmatimonadota bacterium]